MSGMTAKVSWNSKHFCHDHHNLSYVLAFLKMLIRSYTINNSGLADRRRLADRKLWPAEYREFKTVNQGSFAHGAPSHGRPVADADPSRERSLTLFGPRLKC